MSGIYALLPLKPASLAKSRLAALLDDAERATLAALMARDVLGALRAALGINGIVILASDEASAALAREFGCSRWQDPPGAGLRASVQAGLDRLAAEGARGALVVPADLPALTGPDVDALLTAHRGGLSLVRATSDGGTNALLLTPPDAVPCQFGPDSARRHLEAAAARGVHAASHAVAGFARDLDTVDDVRWLCAQPCGGEARQFLLDCTIPARMARAGDARRDA